MTQPALVFKAAEAKSFADEVISRSGQNLLACYQCRRCAAGCPVGQETGITPDRLIRMIALGDREEALDNKLVWQCVSCYTCGTRCPNNIQTARINETLKQMAKEAHVEPKSAKIANFHSSFVTSAKHLGRVNEIEFMGIYEIKNTIAGLKKGEVKALFDEFLAQAKLGMEMSKRKRMHFGIARVKNRKDLNNLLKLAEQKKK